MNHCEGDCVSELWRGFAYICLQVNLYALYLKESFNNVGVALARRVMQRRFHELVIKT